MHVYVRVCARVYIHARVQLLKHACVRWAQGRVIWKCSRRTCGKCVADLSEDKGGVRPILMLRSSPKPPPCVNSSCFKLKPACGANLSTLATCATTPVATVHHRHHQHDLNKDRPVFIMTAPVLGPRQTAILVYPKP